MSFFCFTQILYVLYETYKNSYPNENMRAPIGITNRYRDNIAEYSNKMRIYEYSHRKGQIWMADVIYRAKAQFIIFKKMHINNCNNFIFKINFIKVKIYLILKMLFHIVIIEWRTIFRAFYFCTFNTKCNYYLILKFIF